MKRFILTHGRALTGVENNDWLGETCPLPLLKCEVCSIMGFADLMTGIAKISLEWTWVVKHYWVVPNCVFLQHRDSEFSIFCATIGEDLNNTADLLEGCGHWASDCDPFRTLTWVWPTQYNEVSCRACHYYIPLLTFDTRSFFSFYTWT